MSSSDEDKKSWGSGGLFGNRALGSLALLLLTPVFVLTFWCCCKNHGGSFLSLFDFAIENGLSKLIADIYPTPFDPYCWKLIFSYMVLKAYYQIVLIDISKSTKTY